MTNSNHPPTPPTDNLIRRAGPEAARFGGADALPAGVELRRLTSHGDARGSFTEVFRESWGVGVAPVQWNFVESRANVLRGVHFHLRHADYLIVLAGRASIGVCDLRPDSPTAGRATLVELRGDAPAALTLPPGVAHGFYFHEPSLHAYAVSHYWDEDDERGCRWDDPALGILWPTAAPLLSARDAALPALNDAADGLPLWRPS
jgi:dTDP-4-dehydrorhamnose 3,5-epimerase